MKLDRACISCLERMVDQIAENIAGDLRLKREVIRAGRAMLRENYRPDKPPPWLATRVLEGLSAITGEPDPYQGLRLKEMAAAEEVFRRVRPLYGYDFRSCVGLAVLGNNLDFFRGADALEAAMLKERGGGLGFAIDHIESVESLLRSPDTASVIFLSDNAGEVFFDIPILEKLASLGLRVLYGVKEKPFINDLTQGDLERFGRLSWISWVLPTGTGALLDLRSLSAAFRRELDACSLIISKGQANYECLTELPLDKPVFYLLKAKCQPLSRELRIPLDSHVAHLAEARRP